MAKNPPGGFFFTVHGLLRSSDSEFLGRDKEQLMKTKENQGTLASHAGARPAPSQCPGGISVCVKFVPALRSPLAATGWLSRNHWEVQKI